MDPLLEQLSLCVERGKANLSAPYPEDLRGQPGADELTRSALDKSVAPDAILQACSDGMQRIGEKFGRGEVHVPELLMSARAMNAVMAHLKPYFQAGSVTPKGKFVIGTVAGDLHDIGKNLVAMVAEGNGWKVVDLGVDVKPARFIQAIGDNPGCVVGMSALLTTTMVAMGKTVQDIKAKFPGTKVIVGGAPISAESANRMGADAYATNPQGAVTYLNSCV